MANKKITELTELSAANIANNDVFAIVDVGGDETKKVSVSSLYDIFDTNVTIDTAKIVFGLKAANTNISNLSVNTLPLIGGTVTGTTTFSNTDVMSINAAGNVKIARGLAVGYANKIPGANLDVQGNAYISGATTIVGKITSASLTPAFYGANVTGNVSVTRSLAVGYTDGRVPQANLDVKGNTYISGATTVAGALTLGTQLAVGQGGTGATSLTDGGVLLGSGTGAVTALGVLSDGEMIVGDGATDPVAESGATLRTSIGVGTGDSPEFTGITLSGSTDGGVLLGSGSSAVTATPVLTDGVMLVGDGSTDPALEGNTTLRTSIGVGTGDTPQFYGANITGNASVIRNLAVGYANDKVPGANLDVNGNAYISTDLRVGQDFAVVRDATIGRNLTISGNLTAKGNTFIIHANNLVIDDPIITLAANLKSSQSPPNDMGVLLNRGTESNVFFGYDNSANSYIVAYTPTSANNSIIEIESYATTRVGTLTASSLILGTQLPVGQGGTGVTSLTDGGVLLGSGTGAITALGVLSDGEMIVGDGATDPVAESGATLRTSIGVGTGDTPQFYGANISGNASVVRNIAIGYANDKVPGANLDVNGNAYISGATTIGGALSFGSLGSTVTVGEGGTGATSFTDGGVLLGSGSSALSVTPVLTDGVMLVGDGTTDPALEGNTTLRTSIGVGTGNIPNFWGANASGNVSVGRSLSVGYTDGRIPQANLDIKGNTFVSGKVTTTMTPSFYGANVTGNVSVTRGLAVGYTDGKVPGANLDVNGNAYISGALAVTEIDSASTITLDAETDIVLDAKGGDIYLKDNGTLFGTLSRAAGNLRIKNGTSNDTALTFSNDDTDVTGKLTSSVTPSFNYGANATGNVSITRGIAVGYTDGKVPGANLDVKGNAFIGSTLAVTGAVTSGGSTLQTEGDVLAYAIALG